MSVMLIRVVKRCVSTNLALLVAIAFLCWWFSTEDYQEQTKIDAYNLHNRSSLDPKLDIKSQTYITGQNPALIARHRPGHSSASSQVHARQHASSEPRHQGDIPFSTFSLHVKDQDLDQMLVVGLLAFLSEMQAATYTVKPSLRPPEK